MASLSTFHLGLWLGWQILLNLVRMFIVVSLIGISKYATELLVVPVINLIILDHDYECLYVMYVCMLCMFVCYVPRRRISGAKLSGVHL